MNISCEFHYDSAHYLTSVPPGHKCGNLHGHTYRLIVTLDGPVQGDGFVMDFSDVKACVEPLVRRLDHCLINSVVENPTVENQLLWFADELTGLIKNLSSLTLYEGLRNFATYAIPC